MTSATPLTNQDHSVLKNFQSFLVSKNYSSSTIRNYLADIGNYFEFIKTNSNQNPFSSDILSPYLKSISSDPDYRRYLSSLSKFFQYAQDQGLTKTNPLKSALRDKKPSLDEILTNYQEFLSKKKSDSTVRNYLNDIRQFIDWNQTLLSSGHPPLIKGGNSQQTAVPLHQGELSNEERLKDFSFKNIFRKKEVSSESQ
jgi:hypothetical protein